MALSDETSEQIVSNMTPEEREQLFFQCITSNKVYEDFNKTGVLIYWEIW